MPIQGFELKQHVIGTINALRLERLHSRSEQHAKTIDEQLHLFERELERMRSEEKAEVKARLEAELLDV